MHGSGGGVVFYRCVPFPLALDPTERARTLHRALPDRCARQDNDRDHCVTASHPRRQIALCLLHIFVRQICLDRCAVALHTRPSNTAAQRADVPGQNFRRRHRLAKRDLERRRCCAARVAKTVAGGAAVVDAVVGSLEEAFGVALVEAEASPEAEAGAGEEVGAVAYVKSGAKADDVWRLRSRDRDG